MYILLAYRVDREGSDFSHVQKEPTAAEDVSAWTVDANDDECFMATTDACGSGSPFQRHHFVPPKSKKAALSLDYICNQTIGV